MRNDVRRRLAVDGQGHALTGLYGIDDTRGPVAQISNADFHVRQRSSKGISHRDLMRPLRRYQFDTSAVTPKLQSMLLRGIGVPRADRTVVVLGAGASRGASFAVPGRQVLPPLDADFFQQAQALDEEKYAKYAKPVLQFLRSDYGPGALPTLETVFTQLEGFERFLRQFSTGRGRRTGMYRKQLGHLQQLIPAVFRAAMDDATCDWHSRIAQSLRAGDAVVSFNYDTTIDRALHRWSKGVWLANYGYGVRALSGADAWSAPPTPGPVPKEPLKLLKPHGSLHWANLDRENECLDLHHRPYGQRPAKENVIPPTWDKSILSTWPWKPIWKSAARYLQKARCLVTIGYSVPPTDLMTQALIKSSLGNTELRLLVVVNPDPAARHRVIDLARAGVRPKTRVIELAALEEFALLLDETPVERRRRTAIPKRVRTAIKQVSGEIEDLRDEEIAELEDRLARLEE